MNKILTNQHAYVVSDKHLRKFGLSNGDIVMVVGVKNSPISGDDPYLSKEYHVCILYRGGKHELPDQDNEYKTYVIDPLNLGYVGDEKNSSLTEELRVRYR